jgi:hypothetical protein
MNSKCLKHTPGKKSAMGDKPAHRKGLMGMDLGRLPLVRGVRTVDEFRSQAATVSLVVVLGRDSTDALVLTAAHGGWVSGRSLIDRKPVLYSSIPSHCI